MTPEEYIHDVRQLVASLRNVLTDSEVFEVNRMIDHGEPAEGLRTLAWIIYDECKKVSNQSVLAILTLTSELVTEVDLPPDFAKYGLD